MSKKILSPLRRDGYKAGMIMMLIALSTMLLTTACSSEDDLVNNNNEPTAKKGYELPVTVNVTRGDGATRATYNETDKVLEFSDGDKLFVYGNHYPVGKFAGTLTWQSGGKFSGTIYTESEYTGTAEALFTTANEVTATLLPNGYDANGSNSFLSINNNSTTDIAYDDRLTVAASKAFVASETAKATGVEQLSLEQASTYSSSFTLSPGNAILNFTISGLEAGAKDVLLHIHHGFDYDVFGSVTPNASGVATFAVGVPVGANIKEMSNNLTVGSSNFTLPSSTTFAAGKIYNIARSAASAPAGAEAVDLGLSVKWANMNVGATSVTDFGDYFAWGATTDNYSAGKDYDWANTPYYTGNGNSHSWSKYTSGGATLEAGDDAATANWGGSWRMPTEEEFKELLHWTNITWQTNYQGVSGCNGCLFTSRKPGYTNKSIFLPAAGYRNGSSVFIPGEYGYYWSSTLASDGVDNGSYLYFGSGWDLYSGSRCYGFPVRPVTNANLIVD